MGEKIQFWIWLIVIVASLIARAYKKLGESKKENAPPRPKPASSDSPKQLTFEELLREIQAAKKPAAKPTPQPAFVDYDDDVHTEAKSLENSDYQPYRQESYDLYEKAKREAFSRPSLEETMKLENTDVRFGQFKSYHKERLPSMAAQVAQEIKNPMSFRKAFIMSEILNRRY